MTEQFNAKKAAELSEKSLLPSILKDIELYAGKGKSEYLFNCQLKDQKKILDELTNLGFSVTKESERGDNSIGHLISW